MCTCTKENYGGCADDVWVMYANQFYAETYIEDEDTKRQRLLWKGKRSMDNLTPAQQEWSDFISEFYGDICDTDEQNYFWGLALAGEPPPSGWTDADVEK